MAVAVIGAGPAGLMAAEVLAQGGATVTVYDAMPSAGRKLLMAGRIANRYLRSSRDIAKRRLIWRPPSMSFRRRRCATGARRSVSRPL